MKFGDQVKIKTSALIEIPLTKGYFSQELRYIDILKSLKDQVGKVSSNDSHNHVTVDFKDICIGVDKTLLELVK